MKCWSVLYRKHITETRATGSDTVALHSSSGAADKQPVLDGLPSWQDENIDSAYSFSLRDTAEGDL